MRVDISRDPKATHYCMYCGLTMKARDELFCRDRDGDFCESKKRSPKAKAAKRSYVVELSAITAYLREQGNKWNDRPVLRSAVAREQERFAGRMLLTVANDVEKKFGP